MQDDNVVHHPHDSLNLVVAAVIGYAVIYRFTLLSILFFILSICSILLNGINIDRDVTRLGVSEGHILGGSDAHDCVLTCCVIPQSPSTLQKQVCFEHATIFYLK